MPMQLTITGADGVELATQIHNFVCALQNPTALIAGAKPAANANSSDAKVETPAEKPKKAKTEKAAEKAADAPASKYTLQEVIDLSKKTISDSGDEADSKLKFEKLNAAFGISRVRELPPEKLDDYVAAIEKAFPAKEQAGMFD